MMTRQPLPPTISRRLHMSLREMFLLIAWAAIGCAALKTANSAWWTTVSSSMMLLIMALAIVAAIDRGARQAFALGFLICVSIYSVLIVMNHNPNARYSRELDPYDGDLPTTKLMFPLFEGMVERTEVPIDSPWPQPALIPAGGVQPYPTTTWSEAPDRNTFMRVAHAFWAMLLGYVGGRFAQWIYYRRQTLEDRPAGCTAVQLESTTSIAVRSPDAAHSVPGSGS